MQQGGYDFDFKDEIGYTPIYYATTNMHLVILRLLI